MSKFSKLRELVTLARRLEAEARRMPKGSQGQIDRMALAEEYRVRCLWMAGRIDDEAYRAFLVECADAKAYSV